LIKRFTGHLVYSLYSHPAGNDVSCLGEESGSGLVFKYPLNYLPSDAAGVIRKIKKAEPITACLFGKMIAAQRYTNKIRAPLRYGT
jgi:hypothetical protein